MNFKDTDEGKKLIEMEADVFDKTICEKWPKFFAQRHLPMTETCMCWGFDIGAGWRPMIWEMCQKLEMICNAFGISLEFVQIKEKFGGLRAYTSYSAPKDNPNIKNDEDAFRVFDIIEDIIDKYENASYHICAETGEYYYKKIVIGGWVYDVSPKILKERFKDNQEMFKEIEKQERGE